jgi:hypothetical protein
MARTMSVSSRSTRRREGMSSSLSWKPVKNYEDDFTDEVKYALRKRYGNPSIDGTTLDEGDLPYLNGLHDAGIKGMDEVIAAIEKHSAIEIKETY